MDIIGDSQQIEPFVILAIENQKIETSACYENVANPVWDEKFTFEVNTGKEDLQILVATKDGYQTDEIMGRAAFPLSELKDTMKHEEWIELDDPSGEDKPSGSI